MIGTRNGIVVTTMIGTSLALLDRRSSRSDTNLGPTTKNELPGPALLEDEPPDLPSTDLSFVFSPFSTDQDLRGSRQEGPPAQQGPAERHELPAALDPSQLMAFRGSSEGSASAGVPAALASFSSSEVLSHPVTHSHLPVSSSEVLSHPVTSEVLSHPAPSQSPPLSDGSQTVGTSGRAASDGSQVFGTGWSWVGLGVFAQISACFVGAMAKQLWR